MQAQPFDAGTRASALRQMGETPLDILVIGGGITGVGIARDAALRGLRTGLVEKRDFGFGTSSRSTKIIHGGIRYLAYGHFGLVRESARERWVLRRIAPHLVHPVPFAYPLYAGQLQLKYRIGFHLFDVLAGATGDERHRMLDADAMRRRVPGLRPELRGGGLYPEFVTDDARLTLENAMSAARHGALVANHAEVVALLRAGGGVVGARVRDTLDGAEHEVRATVVVSATGAWTEETLRRGAIEPPSSLLPSKGIHLLFRADRLPLDGATHVRTSYGREGLAIRRLDHVYVGTSDVAYHGDLDRPLADEAAYEDVLRMTRDCFRGLDLTADDVVGTWAGIRPLIAEPGKSTRETSRRDEIWERPDGLVTIVGGKLTTYRAMARRVMERVLPRLTRSAGPDRTADVALPGAPEAQSHPDDLDDALQAPLRGAGIHEAAVRRIAWLHGARAERLLDYGREDPAWLRPLGADSAAIRGEVRLAVEEEMALALDDVLDRRAGLLLFSDDQGASTAAEAAAIMGDLLDWDDARRRRELDDYARLARDHAPPR